MWGFRDSDKRDNRREREETDGQRGIEIVERQGQTETVREGKREIERRLRERRERDRRRRRERLCLHNPGRINSNPGSAHNCPGVATPL